MKNYTQLSMEDRCHFNAFLQMGLSMTEIAQRLKRHRSTLYRELKRNHDNQRYQPSWAHQKAQKRKQRLCDIERYPTLSEFVHDGLKKGWSPEQIAGRLKRRNGKYKISHEPIYKYIYKRKRKKLYLYLPNKKSRRYRAPAKKSPLCRYGDKRIITNRPNFVDNRELIGHWEGDSIAFSGDVNRFVTTLVERKTRLVLLIKNENKKSLDVMQNIKHKFKNYSRNICSTITFDQGFEFNSYWILEKNLRCRVYYCHKHSPWEKGSNENMNGRLRRVLPRKTNIKNLSQEELDIVADAYNNTPRKCLDYRTPREVFSESYNTIRRTWV